MNINENFEEVLTTSFAIELLYIKTELFYCNESKKLQKIEINEISAQKLVDLLFTSKIYVRRKDIYS